MNYIKYLIFLIFLVSCTSSRFVITGDIYPSLPDSAVVRELPAPDLRKHEEIGFAEVKDKGPEKRLEIAKKLGRKYGGEIIVAETDDAGLLKKPGKLALQRFKVYHETEIQEEKPAEPVKVVVPETPPRVYKSDEYEKLPVVPYNILAGEWRNLKGERFIGEFKPLRFLAMPSEYTDYSSKGYAFLEAVCAESRKNVYILVKSLYKNEINKMINEKKSKKKKKLLKVIYTPVSAYKIVYPVLDCQEIFDIDR